MNILGYASSISCLPGDEIRFMISTPLPQFSASLVRLLGGQTDTESFTYETVIADVGTFPGRVQPIHTGSYARVPLQGIDLSSGAFACWIFPTMPQAGHEQRIFTLDGALAMSLKDDGYLTLKAGAASCRLSRPLPGQRWYFVAAQWTPDEIVLHVRESARPLTLGRIEETQTATISGNGLEHSRTMTLAASADNPPASHYNGKIAEPVLYNRLLTGAELDGLFHDHAGMVSGSGLVGRWDFNLNLAGDQVVDISGNQLHGRLFNSPMRAVTGHRWDGRARKVDDNPEHYGAIHFHDDDLEDAGWSPDVTLTLPEDLKTGAYALRVHAGDAVDYVPFFVRPPLEASADVLFLAPTNTYIAYANEHLADLGLQSQMAHETVLNERDRYVLEHPEVGKSIYDLHNDGSGVAYSSRLRPILNFRPDYKTWLNNGPRHLAADLFIIGWLERSGVRYAVATDEDLHRDGIELLSRHRVLVTGSHPEYWTRPMLEALSAWLKQGGRLMYLGGNGFYWVTGIAEGKPHRIEVRRGVVGTRSWNSMPGEITLSSTGDRGGLWRHAGFVPQALAGVGFTAEGWGGAVGYRRLDASYDGPYASLFEGIDDEIIGDFGYVMNGAVGDEIDRLDFDLGTPPQTAWLATSMPLNAYYRLVHEDLLYSQPNTGGDDNPLVRSDMVIFDIDGGGRVFSVGSICYAGALAWNNYDNNICRLTDNVLRLFLSS